MERKIILNFMIDSGVNEINIVEVFLSLFVSELVTALKYVFVNNRLVAF